MILTVNNNKLLFRSVSTFQPISVTFPIKDPIRYITHRPEAGVIVVLLLNLQLDFHEDCNVFGVCDKTGQILWRIADGKSHHPLSASQRHSYYTHFCRMEGEDGLFCWDHLGVLWQIDLRIGSVKRIRYFRGDD